MPVIFKLSSTPVKLLAKRAVQFKSFKIEDKLPSKNLVQLASSNEDTLPSKRPIQSKSFKNSDKLEEFSPKNISQSKSSKKEAKVEKFPFKTLVKFTV